MAKTIADYKKDYEEARKNGDAAGMQAANDGANAIRKQQGQAIQSASQDISNTANKNNTSTSNKIISSGSSGGSSIRYEGDDDDSGYRGSSSGYYNPSKPQGAQYDGPYGDTPIRPLDDYYYQKEQQYKSMYEEARKRALAGDKSAITDMRNANDWMNQVRNDYGLAANSAEGDLSWVKNEIGYYDGGKFIPSSGGGGSGSSDGFGYGSGGWGYDGGYQLSGPEDLSEYLRQMYEAQRQAAIGQIQSAYDKNINAIDQSAIGVDARYQDARNQTAGASEMAKRNFAEFAAATGLNSGAGGQAELSRNVTLQNNLNALNQDEANFYSNIEMQKAQAEIDYNNAIAQAEANNDFAQAQALYQEKIRVQEALRQQELQQMQIDMQQYQIAQQQQQYQDSIKAADRESLAGYGSAFLQQGIMPSDEMLAAMGLTANDAQSYINSLTRVSTEPVLTYAQMMDAINNGQLTPAVLSAYEYYMGTGYQPAAVSAATYSTGSSSGSSSGSGDSGNISGTYKSTGSGTGAVSSGTNEWDGIDLSSVTALGYGPISRDQLERLVDSGQVIAITDPSTGLIVVRKATTGNTIGAF